MRRKAISKLGTPRFKGPSVIIMQDAKPKNRFVHWLSRFLMLLGVMAIISSMSTIAMIASLGSAGEDDPAILKNGTILTYHFTGGLRDTAAAASFSSPLAAIDPTLMDVTIALRTAAKDDSVKAFIARISDGAYGYTEVMELSQAVKDFRKSGKKAYAYSTSFGDFGNGMLEYYLALAFDEIWLQPLGQVSLTGFQAEVPYFRSALDKLGVQAQIFQRKDFKTAPESALRNDMTEANRISLNGILTAYKKAFEDAVVESGRAIDISHFAKALGGAPIPEADAKTYGYVDVIGYVDELVENLGNAHGIDIKAYRNLLGYEFTVPQEDKGGLLSGLLSADKQDKEYKNIALIFIEGAIMPTGEGASAAPYAMLGGTPVSALEISGEIKNAADREDIAAIVLRVNSPGGSPTASETIRRAVIYAQNKGKTIVVSMGEAAASGGYWIVTDADYIMAYPVTLTGSIGVFGGKLVLQDLWNKIGVNWETVVLEGFGGNGLWSQNRPYTESEAVSINRMMDDIYNGFVARVVEGRLMSAEDVERVAQGRVWSGQDAVEQGLVDKIGGLEDTLVEVAAMLEVKRDHLGVIIMPEPLSPLQSFLRMLKKGPSLSSMMSLSPATLQGDMSAAEYGASALFGAARGANASGADMVGMEWLAPEVLRATNPQGFSVLQPAIRFR